MVHGDSSGDSSEVRTGHGSDLLLVSAGQNVIVTDFTYRDMLGFDGAFADATELSAASSIEGPDLVVTLAGDGELRLSGGADRLDDLHASVLDFRSVPEAARLDEYGNEILDGLTFEQLHEVYGQFGSMDGLSDASGTGTRYWSDLDETIARTGATPTSPAPYEAPAPDQAGEPHFPAATIEEDTSADNIRTDKGDEQDQNTTGGGACFVATAAYGDPLHPDVQALRAFRDNHLIRFSVGRGFVRLYWIIGPIMARHTQPDQLHAKLARVSLSAFAQIIRRLGMVV